MSLALFYSYSHKDERYRAQLETHLALLRRQGHIAEWHDRKIGAGTNWENAISEHLESSDIILLLISADFIHSDYCYGKEMKRALERHNAGEVRVIPVILRQVDWGESPFHFLQALPRDGKPVKSWRDRDAAWADVVAGIRKAVQDIESAQPSPGKVPQNRYPDPTLSIEAQKILEAVPKHCRDDIACLHGQDSTH